MGSRNINRIAPAVWRGRAETVEAMRLERWRIEAHCPDCGAKGPVDLVEVMRRYGPGYSLWDRRPPCRRRPACAGVVQLWARPPGVDLAFPLTAPQAAPKGAPLRRATHG